MVQVRMAMRQRAGSWIGVSGGRVQMGRLADGANQTRRAANEPRTCEIVLMEKVREEAGGFAMSTYRYRTVGSG
jgi:hypothetical protein